MKETALAEHPLDAIRRNALLEKQCSCGYESALRGEGNKQQDLHRPVDAGQVKPEEVLCVQEERVVGQDWCVRWQNRWLQIEKVHALD